MKHRSYTLVMLAVLSSILVLAGCGQTTKSTNAGAALDGTPPTAPEGISMITGTDGNQLSWAPSTAPDVALYEIYQYSPDPSRDSAYLLIGSSSTSSFTLPRFNQDVDNYYKVRAVDQSGNASAYSAATLEHVPSIGAGLGSGSGGDPGRKKISE